MKYHASISSAAASHAGSGPHALSPADELRPPLWALGNDRIRSPYVSVGRNGLGGYPARRSPGALRLHPAFIQLNLTAWLINSESQGKPVGIREPILITQSGILISGFAEWHAAVCAGQSEIDSTEFALNDDEALQLVLTLHRPRACWNALTRTELALQQEAYLRSKALANQVAGGKHKALANLPEAEHIDVRQEIANLAGVSARNVDKVKIILKRAHPQLIEALHNGTLRINRALQMCRPPRTEQIEELARFLGERSSSKTTRQFVDQLRLEKLNANIGIFLTALQRLEATKPGSVEVRSGTRDKTVILMGKDHWSDLTAAIGAS